MHNLSWSFAQIWNESLAQREKRKLMPRQNIWASELGGAFIDRWHKMKGVEPSNPFDFRSLRKFETGNLFEWIVEIVLKRAGILIDKQEWVEFQYPNLLRVTGKLDHLAGGTPDWEKVKSEFDNSNLPTIVTTIASNVVEHFSKAYPNGLKPLILETKSVGSFMFHRYEIFKAPGPKDALQIYHYLKAKEMSEGHIIYISKDDLCLVEIGVLNPSPIEEKYKEDIRQMGAYLKSKTLPPLEKSIVYNEITGKFQANWKIKYSQYLTMLYNYKNQNEFETRYKSIAARWNRVLGRIVTNKKITANNKEAIKEIKKDFSNFDMIIDKSKKAYKIFKKYNNG